MGCGPVTLLGDAAHPVLPQTGQGAAQALEDAVALGEALAGPSPGSAALREYERVRAAGTAVMPVVGGVSRPPRDGRRFVDWLRATVSARRRPASWRRDAARVTLRHQNPAACRSFRTIHLSCSAPYRSYRHATEVRGDARLLVISGLNGFESDGKTMPESFA